MKRAKRFAQCPVNDLALLFLLSVVLAYLGIHCTLLTMKGVVLYPSLLDVSPTFTKDSEKESLPLFSTDRHDTTNLLLSPMWKCSAPKNQHQSTYNATTHKLVFVHVFKTAGMTMRELFFRYATSCHAGIGLVSECSGLSVIIPDKQGSQQNNNNDNQKQRWWTNGFGSKKGKRCRMKALNRTQGIMSSPNMNIENSMLSQLDILAGHLPLGAGAAWNEDDTRSRQEQINIQYVTFFRQPITKFVSGIMYQKKGQEYSFDDIVDLIRQRVRGEVSKGKYREGYSAYLLTPQQKERYYSLESISTVADRTRQILHNLSGQNGYYLLVGIVERMSESLELLQFVIDQDLEQTHLFESYGMKLREDVTGSNGNVPVPAKVNNPSKFSTDSVVAELRKDAEFFALLEEYVKYDEQIYAQALHLHKLQYDQLLQHRGQKDLLEV